MSIWVPTYLFNKNILNKKDEHLDCRSIKLFYAKYVVILFFTKVDRNLLTYCGVGSEIVKQPYKNSTCAYKKKCLLQFGPLLQPFTCKFQCCSLIIGEEVTEKMFPPTCSKLMSST